MLLTLLLQTSPANAFDHPAAKWLGGALLFLLFTYPTLEKIYDRLFGGEKAAQKAWQAKVDAELAKFMPQGDIKEELAKLGKQIGENQGSIKLLHDRGEEVSNGLAQRVNALEQHGVNLAQLPQQVQKLNTDHAVLAAEVRQLSSNIDKLSQKQDDHFRDLMQAVERLAFTRGELHSDRRRES
ncbi:MAG: hypothetical protein EOO62_30310 [Hymenobacter sp.]|nr:MAG: hypothetical protein EOO62_30310 [Hymenobacter sp.]